MGGVTPAHETVEKPDFFDSLERAVCCAHRPFSYRVILTTLRRR